MKKLTKALFCSATLILSGCVTTKPMTLDQIASTHAENKAAATRNYPGKSPKEVMQAAQKVLFLLDPPDMKFDVDENNLYSYRMWFLYAVLITSWGIEQYNVNLAKSPNGTQASLAFGGAGSIYAPPSVTFDKNLAVSSYNNPADFKLLHDRFEYVLGMRTVWPTCQDAKAAQKDPSKDMFLCDSYGLENLSPEQYEAQQAIR